MYDQSKRDHLPFPDCLREWNAKEKTPDDIARQNVLDKIKEFKGGALSNVTFDGKSMVN